MSGTGTVSGSGTGTASITLNGFPISIFLSFLLLALASLQLQEFKLSIKATNTEPKYKILINGTSHSETFAILMSPPRIITPVTPAKIIPAILAMITVQILLLFFGKYLWNNYLVKKVTGIKPLESVLELLAISILLKLLVN